MLSDRQIEDLKALIEIGHRQNGRLNSMLVSNYYVSLPSNMHTAEAYEDIVEYLEKSGVEVVNDAVEVDETDDAALPQVHPFDPSYIDIEMKTMALSGLISRVRYNELDLNTAFQRKSGLWTRQQKSQLIESLILRIPLPAFYFDGGVPDRWLIIDGLQRITALKEFVVDQTLSLNGLEFFTDLEGATYSELPRTFQRRIEETNIVAFIVKSGTPDNVKYNIFKRINTGGLKLEPQEIRHALYQGIATEICAELAQTEDFMRATCGSIRTDRMMDEEFVLRFVAVCFYDENLDKYDGVLDNYLNGAMEYMNSGIDQETREKIVSEFKRTMDIAYDLFERYAFRKLGMDEFRRPINKAIFEVWCRIIMNRNDDEVKLLKRRKKELFRKFQQLCQQDEFLSVIKASDKKSFGLRFDFVYKIVEEVLYAH